RVGPAAGKASIYSVSNDNSLYRLDLENAGPLDEGTSRLGLGIYVDSICIGAWGHSDRHANGTINLSFSVHGEKEAEKIADHFKVELKKRANPGHRIGVQWTADKKTHRIGEPIVLTLKIQNIGMTPITFVAGGQQRGARDNQFRFLAYEAGGG